MHEDSAHKPVLSSTVPMLTVWGAPHGALEDGLVSEDEPPMSGETTVTLPSVLASRKLTPVVLRSRTSSVVHVPLGERVAERRTTEPIPVRSASHTTTKAPFGRATARGATSVRNGKLGSRSTGVVSHGPPRGR